MLVSLCDLGSVNSKRGFTLTSFTVIEWTDSNQADVQRVGVEAGRIGAPQSVAAPGACRGEPMPVCFRPDELAGDWRELWDDLADRGGALDARQLARVVFPTLDRYDLPGLASHVGLEFTTGDSAARAAIAGEILQRTIAALQTMPLGVLTEMERLLKPMDHALKRLVSQAASEAVRRGFGAKGRSLTDLLPAALQAGARRRPEPRNPSLPLDDEAICGLFGEDGLLAKNHKSYEHRPEQIRMVREVCRAFNDGLVLMVEAGTGTGKSMAYLAPAATWAMRNDDPVVVSTNTKNLQSQLMTNDLPLLTSSLGKGLRYALIKGRSNYLCLRKFLMTLRDADRELSDRDRLQILPLIAWLSKTKSGDVAECGGFEPGMASDLWRRVSTRPEECAGNQCRWFRRCFVRRARAAAAQSDVIIANHAAVFSDCAAPNPVLPEHRCVIFDEAHNIEDVITNCLQIEVRPGQVGRILGRLWRGRRDRTGQGLLASLRFHLSRQRDAASRSVAVEAGKRITDILSAFDEVKAAEDAAFRRVDRLLANQRGRMSDRIRYDNEAHRLEGWSRVAQGLAACSETLRRLAGDVKALAGGVERALEKSGEQETARDLQEVLSEIGAQAGQLGALADNVDVIAKGENPAYVYWAQSAGRRTQTTLCAAPIDIADLMNEFIFSRSRTVVFVSATLTAGGTFDFMRDRLGLRGPVAERLHTADLGSSFTFAEQSLLAVPLFLPAPRARAEDFVAPFCDLAEAVLTATRGRALLLFTSHSMLRAAADRLRPVLGRAGLPVLVQGQDGARDQLIRTFTRETASVLLGTASFWEGVDVPGESLSCLLLARLPFRPHTDPIIAARCERLKEEGRSDFTEYLLPDAVIRLKQGFGRLIRSRRDRGVVVICDSRLVTKGYGRVFRDSLPVTVRTFRQAQPLVETVRTFLGAEI